MQLKPRVVLHISIELVTVVPIRRVMLLAQAAGGHVMPQQKY